MDDAAAGDGAFHAGTGIKEDLAASILEEDGAVDLGLVFKLDDLGAFEGKIPLHRKCGHLAGGEKASLAQEDEGLPKDGAECLDGSSRLHGLFYSRIEELDIPSRLDLIEKGAVGDEVARDLNRFRDGRAVEFDSA